MEMVLLEYVEFVAKDLRLLLKENGMNPNTFFKTANSSPAVYEQLLNKYNQMSQKIKDLEADRDRWKEQSYINQLENKNFNK